MLADVQTNYSLLAEVLSTYSSHINQLAENWLSAGATSFSVWWNNRLLACWPSEGAPQQPGIAAPIRTSAGVVGDLRVSGLGGREVRARLATDATLVAGMVQQEQELHVLSGALVERQEQLLALYEIAHAMHGHVTVENTLRSLTYETKRIYQAEHTFAVFLQNALQPTLVQTSDSPLDERVLWEIFWETHVGERARLLPADDPRLRLIPEVSDLLLVPLRQRDGINGVLGIAGSTRRFTHGDLKLAQTLATMAHAQLENVLLYQETVEQARMQAELELARRVQVNLMPQPLPPIAGVDVFATSRPALHVGGDFYDLIYRPGRPLIFSVGDIAGKGLSSALLMTMTRTAIHSKASFMPEPNPAVVMRQSNEDLYDDFARMGVFATVIIGEYHAAERRITYANAGHSPVIYRPAGGTPRLLMADSPAMGVTLTSEGRNHTIPLAPGDLLVVATDGLADARNPAGDMFSTERLMELVDALADQPAQVIAQELRDAVIRFEDGRSQDDDQTMVVLKGVME